MRSLVGRVRWWLFSKKSLVSLILSSGWMAGGVWTQAAAAQGAGTSAGAASAATDSAAELDIEGLRQKYWAEGQESQMAVVQNRLFSKARKFHFGLGMGPAYGDPFLSMKTYQWALGYHFNEFWGLSLIGMPFSVSKSNAYKTLIETGKDTNTVEPNSYTAIEGTSSFLYGKLSLAGRRIVYYDMHLSAGGGLLHNEYDTVPGVHWGLSQRFYINQWLSFKFDYRMLAYQDHIFEEVITKTKGTQVGSRSNFTHTLNFGLDVLLDVPGLIHRVREGKQSDAKSTK